MNKNIRNLLLALATTAAVGVPLAGYALAQTTPNQRGTVQGQSTGDNDAETQDDQAPAYRSSIQLPAEQQGTEVSDAQEEAQLRALARITPTQASQAAQAAVPGMVNSVKLEDEDGNLGGVRTPGVGGVARREVLHEGGHEVGEEKN